jgi:hypothetical protein
MKVDNWDLRSAQGKFFPLFCLYGWSIQHCNCNLANPSGKKQSDELSPEQSALAKKIFVAFGFLGIAIVIIVLDIFLPIEYVVIAIVAIGLAAVALVEQRHSAGPQDNTPK